MSGECNWFTGVVEDIHDPEMMNRVKVRIHGLHSDKLELDPVAGKGIKTEELPWAYVSMPTTGSGMHGFGQSPHGLVEGSWVLGISRDGKAYNELVVLAVLLGRPTEENPNDADPKQAFYGMDGLWPDKEFLDKPDVHRLARNDLSYDDDKWKPIPTIKDEERTTGISLLNGGSWDEKNTPYAAEYPYNKILFDGPSRTLLEIDETPGAERIGEWHGPSHTYREVHPDGSIQTKIVGDDYKIVQKDNNVYVEGNVNLTVVGSVNVLTESGDVNVQTRTGDVSIENTLGDINIENDVGNINIENDVGDIKLKSLAGAIDLQTLADDITLNSGLGSVVIKGRKLKIKSASVSGGF